MDSLTCSLNLMLDTKPELQDQIFELLSISQQLRNINDDITPSVCKKKIKKRRNKQWKSTKRCVSQVSSDSEDRDEQVMYSWEEEEQFHQLQNQKLRVSNICILQRQLEQLKAQFL